MVLLAGFLARSVCAQAPGLQWTTNIGARLFAVDAQTNVYANAGGTVIRLTSAGVPAQTNTICPVPGIARRDDAGNFYFGGSFDGTQDFGGITLAGGWTNWPSPGHWTHGYPTCYLAKYSSGGNLQWVVSFGQQAVSNSFTDLLLDSGGGCYVGYLGSPYDNGAIRVAHFSNVGSDEWERAFDGYGMASAAVTLGGLTTSNCCFFDFQSTGMLGGGRIDLAGNRTGGWYGPAALRWVSVDSTNGKPVIDDLGQAFQVGQCWASPCSGTQVLRKFALDGTILRNAPVGVEEQWTLARDVQPYIYLGGENGLFAKYDTDCTLIWSTNYGQKCFVMIVDAAGNRFVSFADGEVARLATEPPPILPSITQAPQGKTVFVGDSVTLSVAATGTPPLRYFWLKDGTNAPNGTNASLAFGSATASQSGSYSVVVTNAAGAITSAPALLRVRSVALYVGSQLLTNGTYYYQSAPTFTIRSAFPNGSSFYTLDGSAPDFNSTYYSGPFALSNSATVRAIGYSADFFQSQEADTVNAVVGVTHTLSATSPGGGSVTLNPPGGVYPSTNIVAATAVPSPGWSFLYWLGDASGTNPTVSISMERNKAIQALFGTTLSTTVAGNGQAVLNPPGGLYAYGTVVRLTGVPQPGNYFGFWGNAATGNTNPLYFSISSPTQTVSSIFAATPAGQAALTVLINGSGRVDVNPRANVYPTNQSVTLTAVPDAGQSFINWSGDASGTQNPLTISMTQSKVITANFSSSASLRVDMPGSGLTPQGFRAVVVSDPGLVFQIFGSTGMSDWQLVATVTNTYGEAQFTDPGALNYPSRFYKLAPAGGP